MDRTESTLRKLHAALDSDSYDIGVLDSRGMYPRLEAVPFSRVLRLLPYLKYRNVNGAHIYFRPGGESRFTLLDDLTADALRRLEPEGYAPCAVVETSPGNYQAWLKHARALSKELGTSAAKLLAQRFHADSGAADWRRFGRLPGFTNRKPQHRNAAGLYPFSRLISSEGRAFQNAEEFYTELRSVQFKSAVAASKRTQPFYRAVPVSLMRFRESSRYAGRPAAADMAFSIAAWSQGWPVQQIEQALAENYLSRDTRASRRSAYIERTIRKALKWAA